LITIDSTTEERPYLRRRAIRDRDDHRVCITGITANNFKCSVFFISSYHSIGDGAGTEAHPCPDWLPCQLATATRSHPCDKAFTSNFSTVKSLLGQLGHPDQDLNGNGIVDPIDFSLAKGLLGQPPGHAGALP